MSNFDLFTADIQLINDTADSIFESYEDSVVADALKYSFSNGGKRIRPLLTLYFSELVNGNSNAALKFGTAVEMIHTYSLIHDDLPCMDNDDYRRGKPSCHKQFGEANALLAGDALLTESFKVLSSASLPSDNICHAVYYLSSFAGINGMVGGQVLDLSFEHNTPGLEEVKKMYSMKTCALLKAACVLGCLTSDILNKEQIEKAEKYAEYLGLAFQIQDDILDITGDESVIGKPVGSDEKNDKPTFVRLYGLEESKKLVSSLSEKAKELVTDSEKLCALTDALSNRNY
ncbi:MAG: polyprenyl synthetase family protein [Clostridiales bacterium]|nr:polyprenyl synthetase family protein [Clostridiales bacterium]